MMVIFGIVAVFGASGLIVYAQSGVQCHPAGGGRRIDLRGSFVLKNNQRIEYDYTFTNGTLDIAKVINNSKRKRVLSVNVREFDQVAHTSDPGISKGFAEPRHQARKYNCFLNKGGGLYYGVMIHEGQKASAGFRANARRCLSYIKVYNPRNVQI